MVKTYDFGTNTKTVSANERKPIAWPIAVWSCYIPESEVQDINILEHLILQLIDKGYSTPKDILCIQVGFNKDLVDAAIEACDDKGYFDKRFKELKLSSDGKSILGKYDNPYTSDLEASKNARKIYMFQDLVTKNVIPVFDISRLPDFYYDDEAIQVSYDGIDGKKPKSASIRMALRYWARLCSNRNRGLLTGDNSIDISEPPAEDNINDEALFFEDEVEWESIQDDGSVKVKTLADKEEADQREKTENLISNITILDDSPEIYYARGYIAINRNAPEEVLILSPFGERLDDWYRTLVNRLRVSDQDFEDEIQFFLEEKKEELKNTIAFGNDLDIALFNEFPFICNDNGYKAVKKTITRLTICKNRIVAGEDESINFAQAIRTAYEASIRLVVKKNAYLLELNEIDYEEYKQDLNMLVNSYSFLNRDIYREYCGHRIYTNMTEATGDKGYATAYMALLLLDAWKDKNGKSMDLLRNIPSIPIRFKELTSSLRTENQKNGAGTIASHGGDEIADLKVSVKQATTQYEEFENLFRAIYNRFMEDI